MTYSTTVLLFFFLVFSSCKTPSTPYSKTLNASLALEHEATLGEGAIWNHQSQELLWIDIMQSKLHFFNPVTKINRSLTMPSHIGTVVPINKSEAVVALRDGIYTLETSSGALNVLSEEERDLPTNRFNDGKCDPSGRLWVGSMAYDKTPKAAALYMIDGEGNSRLKIDDISVSNGIVWSSNKKNMYYIDSATGKIVSYTYQDLNGNISEPKTVVTFDSSIGFLDGMAIDENDNLWVGIWNGNKVICFDHITGEIISEVVVPAHNITACAFGGKNLDTLYITTAREDMTPKELQEYPLAGSVFKVVPGVKGVKSAFFKPKIHPSR